MATRYAVVLSGSLLVFSLVALAASVVLRVANGPLLGGESLFAWLGVGVASTSFSFAGAVIAARRPRNPIGWLFLTIGVSSCLSYASGEYAVYGLITAPGRVIGAVPAAWLYGWLWLVPLGLPVFVLLLFPDGRLPTRRWRPVALGAAVALAVALATTAVQPRLFEDQGLHLSLTNPLAVDGLAPLIDPALVVSLFILGALAVAGGVSLLARYRQASGDERDQLRWVAVAGLLVGVALVVPYELPFVLAVPLVPAAAAAAVLRYHLYDIDRLVTRAGAYAMLAAFTTVLYLVLLIGVGSFAGARRSDLALAVVATASAAVVFQPARGRLEALIRRVVLGPRATPYATLAAFSRDVAGAASTDDLPRRMAAAVAAGIGAVHVVVTVPLPDGAEQASTWPPDLPAGGATTAAAGGVPYIATVHHERRVVGHIAVVMPDGRAVTATERRLLDDLAAQCGPALRTVALTEELRRTLEEVQASRLRIVAAQDQERQRIERDLHDGVQQHLHALSANLGVVAQHARDDRVLSEGIERAAEQADRAQATLRALVRGICPPILHDRGLAAAVRAAGDAAEVPFTLDVNGGTQRWPRAVETAAYFCCREALQNAAKHACAQHVTVTFDGTADLLTFTVSDDGRGFDPSTHRNGTGLHNLTDRLAAVGGRLEIRSTPNAGTTVAGRIPTTST